MPPRLNPGMPGAAAWLSGRWEKGLVGGVADSSSQEVAWLMLDRTGVGGCLHSWMEGGYCGQQRRLELEGD